MHLKLIKASNYISTSALLYKVNIKKIKITQKVLVKKFSFQAHFDPWTRQNKWYLAKIADNFFSDHPQFKSTVDDF